MDIERLNDDVSVSARIGAEDLSAIAALGFRSIVCNRPDGEAGDQPSFEEIREAAEAAGLGAVHLPIESGKPPLYRKGMLEGRERLARPEMVD